MSFSRSCSSIVVASSYGTWGAWYCCLGDSESLLPFLLSTDAECLCFISIFNDVVPYYESTADSIRSIPDDNNFSAFTSLYWTSLIADGVIGSHYPSSIISCWGSS